MTYQISAITRKNDAVQAFGSGSEAPGQGSAAADLFEEFSRILDKIAVQVQVDQTLPEPTAVALRPKKSEPRKEQTAAERPEYSADSPRAEDELAPAPRGADKKDDADARASTEKKDTPEQGESVPVAASPAEAKSAAPTVAPTNGPSQPSVPAAAQGDQVGEQAPLAGHLSGEDPALTPGSSQGRAQGSTSTPSNPQARSSGAPATAPVAEVTPTAPQGGSEPVTGSEPQSELAQLLKAVREQLGIPAAQPTTRDGAQAGLQQSQTVTGLELARELMAGAGMASAREIAATAKSGLGVGEISGKAPVESIGGAGIATRLQGDLASKGELARTARQLPRAVQQRTLEKVEAVLKEVAQSKDGKTISLRLDPPQLGSLKVDVSYRENTLHARIVAESSAVVSVLRERAFELQEALRKIGLDVDKITVAVEARVDDGVGGQDTGAGQQPSGQQQYDRGGSDQGGFAFPLEPSVLDVVTQIDDHWVA